MQINLQSRQTFKGFAQAASSGFQILIVQHEFLFRIFSSFHLNSLYRPPSFQMMGPQHKPVNPFQPYCLLISIPLISYSRERIGGGFWVINNLGSEGSRGRKRLKWEKRESDWGVVWRNGVERGKVWGFIGKLSGNPVKRSIYFGFFKSSILLQMSKPLAFLLVLVVLAHAGQLGFQTGSDIATLVRNQSGKYYGQYNVQCVGGQAPYQVQFSNLPSGWSQQGNTITIPNIIYLSNAEYSLSASITDSQGANYRGDLILVINGVSIRLQNSAGSGSGLGFAGSTGSGVFSTGSGLSTSGSGFSNVNLGFSTTGSISGGFVPSGSISFPSSGSGSSPSGTISFPSSGSPSGSSPSSPSIASLYDSYPGLPAGSFFTPSSGSFPTNPSPSGNPSTPNIVPSVIQNSQAPYVPSRDTKITTPDQVKQTAAFNRQLNANKGVANLISIIQQLTANVNAAKNDISILQSNLNQATAANNACTNQIYELSNTKTKIENAIRDRQGAITDANVQISQLTPMLNDLNRIRNELISQRTEIQNKQSPNSAKLSQLERELANCVSMKVDLQNQLNDVNDEIRGVQSDIQVTRTDAAGAPQAINQINAQIPLADVRVRDLKAQLAIAQAARAKLDTDKAMYQRMINEANTKISNLNRTLSTLQSKVPGLQRDIAAKQANCDRIQVSLDEFRGQLAQIDANFKTLTQRITTQDRLIAEKKAQIDSINGGFSNIPGEIVALQAELTRTVNAISRQYYICNDAADAVRTAKQNLDAMQLKYTTESGLLRDANNNLEKARAEKELADIAVQEIIASSTSGLPFAFVPNGNGQTNPGTPNGNNPSGNALGAVRQSNTVVYGSPAVVGDLQYYLSSAYGAGVDVTKPSTVTTLYPLSILTLEAITGQSQSGVFNPDGTFVTGNNLSGNAPYGGGSIPASYLAKFSCSGNSNLVQGQGTVLGVQPGLIRVQGNNGQTTNLNIGSCSSLNSNSRGLTVIPGTSVYYKGSRSGSGVNLYEMTCVV